MVLLARTEGQLDETRALLREQGVPARRISVLPADLADEEDRDRAVAAALAAALDSLPGLRVALTRWRPLEEGR